MLRKNKGFFYVLGSAILFGTQPLWAKVCEAEGMATFPFLFIRSIVSWIAIMAICSRRSVKQTREVIEKKDYVILIFAALFGMVLTPLLLVGSYEYLNAGAATSLHFSYPLYISIMGIIVFKEKVNKKDILCLCVCMLGIVCLFSPGQVSSKGIIMAVLSGIMYGSYTVILDKTEILHRVSSFRISKIAYSISILIYTIIFIANRVGVSGYSFIAYFNCFAAGILLNVIGVLLFQKGVSEIGGRRAGILSAAEPVTSLIIGLLCFNEFVSGKELIGSALIITSSILTIIL